jgi:hypothetical protein
MHDLRSLVTPVHAILCTATAPARWRPFSRSRGSQQTTTWGASPDADHGEPGECRVAIVSMTLHKEGAGSTINHPIPLEAIVECLGQVSAKTPNARVDH